MASIRRETTIAAPPDRVWAALRDVGAIHTRLAPGFVTEVTLEEGARVVTFGSGRVVREWIIDVDEKQRRVAWSAESDLLTHHNASAQVLAEGPSHTRFVWIADVLPDAAAPTIAGMIELGLDAIRRHLEQVAATLDASGAPAGRG